MKIQPIVRTIVLALSLLVIETAHAAGAQQENPLFVEARSLWQQISNSSLDNSVKAPYGQRFGDLAAEQRSLWTLAGEVDSGACAERCLDNYNNRVLSWQSNLQSFNNDASMVLPKLGKWEKYGKWSQINVACRQVYICRPAETIMHGNDMIVVGTPAQTVTGVCHTNTSDPESCSECTATLTPPTERCLWHLEKR